MDTISDDDMARVPATNMSYDHVDPAILHAAVRATHARRRIVRLGLRGRGGAGCSIRNIAHCVEKDGNIFFSCTDMSGRRRFSGYSTLGEGCIFSQL